MRVWALPPASRTTYAPFDASIGIPLATLVGHTDAVWDLVLVKEERVLVTCGAEGKVKVWDVSPGALPTSASKEGGKLITQWGYNGTGAGAETTEDGAEATAPTHSPGATSLAMIKTDLRMIAVAYRDAVVKIFDLESGKETARLPSDTTYGSSWLSLSFTLSPDKEFNLLRLRWHAWNTDQQNRLAPNHPSAHNSTRRPIHPDLRPNNKHPDALDARSHRQRVINLTRPLWLHTRLGRPGLLRPVLGYPEDSLVCPGVDDS